MTITKYLKMFCTYLKRFLFKSGKAEEKIPKFIDGDEIIVRAMLCPLFFSESRLKLKDPAFSPPPGKNDVSVLRHDYTTSDYCKVHGKSLVINGSKYGGLAIIRAASIAAVNTKHAEKIEYGPCVSVSIKASPLPNLPMHADILYSIAFPDDEPQIQIRMIARELIKQTVLLKDPAPEEALWKGEPITLATLREELSKRMAS